MTVGHLYGMVSRMSNQLPEGMNYEHDHNDWADGDCTRCLHLDTYLIPSEADEVRRQLSDYVDELVMLSTE